MFWFTNYVEVAQLAYKQKLIHYKGVQRILTAARREIEEIKWQSSAQKKKALDSFEKSCDEAHHLIVRETKKDRQLKGSTEIGPIEEEDDDVVAPFLKFL